MQKLRTMDKRCLKGIMILLIIVIPLASIGQNVLVFTNSKLNKVIEVKAGQFLSVRYNGYLGQPEFFKNVVTEITDSTILLGIQPELISPVLKNRNIPGSGKVIRITDISAFRRMRIGRQLLKSMSILGLAVGDYFLLSHLFRNVKISSGSAFLISLGAGIGGKIFIDLLYPESPKFNMSEGWQVSVVRR